MSDVRSAATKYSTPDKMSSKEPVESRAVKDATTLDHQAPTSKMAAKTSIDA